MEQKGKVFFKHMFLSHLNGACHCAEGEHGGRVLDGGLAVECSLSVNKEHSNLRTAAGGRFYFVKDH